VSEGQKLLDFLNRKRRVVFRDFLDRTAEFRVLDNLVSQNARTLHHRLPRDFAGDAFNQITPYPIHRTPIDSLAWLQPKTRRRTLGRNLHPEQPNDPRVQAEFLKLVKNGAK
jgi:hypothetical protein